MGRLFRAIKLNKYFWGHNILFLCLRCLECLGLSGLGASPKTISHVEKILRHMLWPLGEASPNREYLKVGEQAQHVA
jgi:hypothetical protein